MSVKEKAYQLLEEKLKERPDIFLIDFDVSDANDIKIVLDGDRGVTVQDLVDFSRAIEHNMDRDEEDFSLTVSSFDISKPFNHVRQYKKNLSRNIKVKTEEGEKEGKLTDVNENEITIEYKMRVPKEVGKGKKTIIKQDKIPFEKIKESKVVIKF
jgi:ribosome maturation factor RimP